MPSEAPRATLEAGGTGSKRLEMVEISVITPVLRTDHLEETLRSLEAQTLPAWEWVLVPTTGIRLTDTLSASPESSVATEKVRIIHPSEAISDPTAARIDGVERARGRIVMFLEDGEVLAPDALERIAAALDDDDTDIVYSDFALFPIGGQPAPNYHSDYGWITGTIDVGTETLRSVEAFEPLPSALSHASYAPRHGLAMTKETYLEFGGHDRALGVASTFGFVCSSFVSGARYRRIPEVLVFTRFANYGRRDAYLEKTLSDTYTLPIVHEWSRQQGLTMLDLGAAHNPMPGYVSVDLQDATINCDLRFGLPLPDDSVGAIRAYDFLEHMNTCPDSACTHGADGVSPRCVVGIMNEFYRVLAPGGWLLTHTPSSDGRGAFQDPTHVSYWNPNSFWYYTRAEQARFLRGVTCRFQMARLWQGFASPWHQENNLVYVDADLVALKGQSQPGICEI